MEMFKGALHHRCTCSNGAGGVAPCLIVVDGEGETIPCNPSSSSAQCPAESSGCKYFPLSAELAPSHLDAFDSVADVMIYLMKVLARPGSVSLPCIQAWCHAMRSAPVTCGMLDRGCSLLTVLAPPARAGDHVRRLV